MTGAAALAFRKGRHVVLAGTMPPVGRTISLLAVCVALNATAFGIVIPVFGRRLGELGYGAADLSLLTGAYALAQLVTTPLWGALSDRIGRKPVVIVSLLGHLFGNLAYLFLTDLPLIVAVRFAHGFLATAVSPVTLAVVADIAPARQRGRWLALIMAAHAAAFVLGPVIGGALFDLAGFAAAFVASAVSAALALLIVTLFLKESLTPRLRNRNRLMRMLATQNHPRLANRLPRPLSTFAVLFLAIFTPTFAISFVEPQFIFFAFDVLDWNTTQYGLILFAYGIAIISTQLMFAHIADSRFGRRWGVSVGIVMESSVYWVLTFAPGFSVIFLAAAVSGIGQGLASPAVGLSMLNLAAPHQRATVMGLRGSASGLGALAGPALAFMVSGHVPPTTAFAGAAVFIVVVALIAAWGLRVRPVPTPEYEIESYRLRSLAAQATLRGLVVRSANARLG